MTRFDADVLALTVPKVRAWELLHDPQHVAHLNMTQYYDLMRAAGYTEEVAGRLASEHGWERLNAGVQM